MKIAHTILGYEPDKPLSVEIETQVRILIDFQVIDGDQFSKYKWVLKHCGYRSVTELCHDVHDLKTGKEKISEWNDRHIDVFRQYDKYLKERKK